MTGLCVLTHGDGANNEPLHREAEIGYLCKWHRDQLTRTIRDIRELWIDLAFIVEAGTAPKDTAPRTRHLKAAEAPAPANLDVLALRDPRSAAVRLHARTHAILRDGSIAGVSFYPNRPAPGEVDRWDPRIKRLTFPTAGDKGDQTEPLASATGQIASWVLLVAEERRLTVSALPDGMIAQLDTLERHHDWMAAQDWIDAYWGEIQDLRRTLTITVRDREYFRVATCDLPTDDGKHPVLIIRRNRALRIVLICGGEVMVKNGDDVWTCRSCNAKWVTDQQKARFAVRNAG